MQSFLKSGFENVTRGIYLNQRLQDTYGSDFTALVLSNVTFTAILQGNGRIGRH